MDKLLSILYEEEDYYSLIKYINYKIINNEEISNIEYIYYGCTLTKINKPINALASCEKVQYNYLEKNTPDVFRFIGLCYYMIGDYINSKKSLIKWRDLSINEKQDAIDWIKLLNFDDELITFDRLNLRFHFHRNLSFKLINDFIDNNLFAYSYIQNIFHSNTPKKIDIFVYLDEKDSIGNNLSYSNPPMCTIHTNLYHTNGHELVHIITYYLYDDIQKSRFIDEGIATYFDMPYNGNIEKDIKFYKGLNINIIDLWNNFERYDTSLSYKIAGLFIGYIIKKFSIKKLIEFIRNQSIENAYEVFGCNFKQIIYEFEKMINNEENYEK